MKTTYVTLIFTLLSLITLDLSASSRISPPDSVGVKSIGGKKFIVHKIDKGESFYSIAKKYNVTVKELQDANPDITDKIIAGKILFIPIKDTSEVSIGTTQQDIIKIKDTTKKTVDVPIKPIPKNDSISKTIPAINKPQTPIKYTVKGGDNLGMIAGKYHTLVSTIMKLNNLNSDRINIGQILIVGYETAQSNGKGDTIEIKQPIKVPTSKDTLTASKKESVRIKKDSLALKKDSVKKMETMKQDSVKKADKASMSSDYKTFQANNKPMKEFQEKGIAAWIDDEDVNPRKYFGLHRTAPIGTIIKVTNPMNNRYVFVKIVGTLPDTGDNANIIIKISKASASKLEVLDAHFQAILDFATNEY